MINIGGKTPLTYDYPGQSTPGYRFKIEGQEPKPAKQTKAPKRSAQKKAKK